MSAPPTGDSNLGRDCEPERFSVYVRFSRSKAAMLPSVSFRSAAAAAGRRSLARSATWATEVAPNMSAA